MSKTLDLGCGAKPRNPFDADELFGVDVRDDLNIKKADLVIEPIPYPDESFEYVTAYDFLEHVPRLVYAPDRRNAFVEVMNEVHRVLKPGGLFLSSTPAYPHGVAFRDPTHVNFITEETFPMYFDDQTRWASIYGFKGAFNLCLQQWRGPHLFAVLRKVPVPGTAPLEAVPESNRRVSVVIPVHNGEKYLASTLDSALAQTHRDFELVCVDDGSTDGSLELLDAYARRDPRVRVLRTGRNLGSVPKVLNFALPQLTGGYFVYSSQDDWYSVDWLEKLLARAVETGADAVLPDVVMAHGGDPSRDHALIGLAGDRGAVLSGREAMRHSMDWRIPCNALWRLSLVRRVGYEEFAYNADEYSGRVFFLNANKVVFCDGVFHYRQDNAEAITRKVAPRSFEQPYTHWRLAGLLREQGFPAELAARELQKAVDAMRTLSTWLATEGGALSPADREDVRGRIARYEAVAARGHVLDVRTESKASRRLAKWKRSVRKLLGRVPAPI